MREEGVGHVLVEEGGGADEVEGYSFWYLHSIQLLLLRYYLIDMRCEERVCLYELGSNRALHRRFYFRLRAGRYVFLEHLEGWMCILLSSGGGRVVREEELRREDDLNVGLPRDSVAVAIDQKRNRRGVITCEYIPSQMSDDCRLCGDHRCMKR